MHYGLKDSDNTFLKSAHAMRAQKWVCGWMLTHAALVYTGILGTKVQKNEGRC